MRKAKDAATRQNKVYDEEKRNQHNQRVTDLYSNRDYIEDIEKKNKQEISEVEKQFNKNKSNVIEYLFDNVIHVDYILPEVIKGNFEERLLANTTSYN
jgi:uncharacterized membrane-anchored protein